MNYDLHGVAELVTALVIFGTIAIWMVPINKERWASR
jgi:hypothetical protein